MFTPLIRIRKILIYLRKAYQLDVRALSLMRIGMAVVILADLLIRGADLEAHYSDAGCWPADLALHTGWKKGWWSFHSLYGSKTFELVLFCLHAALAIFLLLGFKTRFVTFLLYLFTISLHNRNIFILQGGDDLLRLILLWGIFLPWGSRYSMDSRHNSQEPKQPWMSGLGYLLLIVSVYLFSVLLKTGADWHHENSAFYYALSLEQIRLPVGDWIYPHPAFLKVATFAAYFIELGIALLLLLPLKKQWNRLFAFLLIVLLHTGIGLTLYVGLFFVISMVAAIGLLPAYVFDAFEKRWEFLKQNRSFKKKKTWLLLANNFSILIIVICFTINLNGLSWFPYKLQEHVEIGANALRLEQYWGMFSPTVLRKDGWMVYHGRDSLGRQWDLRLNQDYVDYKKPRRIVGMYKSDRWRKLAENLQDDRFTFLRPLYCKYVLKKWNQRHPKKQLLLLNLYFMEKENLPDYKTSELNKRLFCVCDAG